MKPLFANSLTWIMTKITRLPSPFVFKTLRGMSINLNIKLVQLAWPGLPLPNVNTPFNPLSRNSNVRWFFEVEDRQPEDPVIVFLHGGGYFFGLFPPFLSMLLDLYVMLGRDRSRLSILILDYSLGEPYPTQLNELIDVYGPLKKTSKNIALFGDSSGGHLALSLIRHSQKPMESVPPVEVGEELQHLILLSPWVNLWPEATPGSSHQLFQSTDIIPTKLLSDMGALFYNGPNKEMINPISWTDLRLPKTFISCGAKECLRDDILLFAKHFEIRPFVDTAKGLHDSAPFWPMEIMNAVAEFLTTESPSNHQLNAN